MGFTGGHKTLPRRQVAKSLTFFLCAAILALALLVPAIAQAVAFNRQDNPELAGTVVFVPDGDTITVNTGHGKHQKVRLYGVDCPELGQPFGKIAAKATADLVLFAPVTLTVVDKDKYNRLVAIVTMRDGRILNRELLERGMAWLYAHFCKKDFCRDWKKLEQNARAKQRGLWRQRNPTPPWQWRAANPRR